MASRGIVPTQSGTVRDFLALHGAWRIVADLALLSVFAGLYSVPLYALIQSRAQKTHVARIVAANNILNALFIVVASIAAAVLLGSGLTIPQLFLVAALMNAAVAAYIYLLVPEFLLRFIAWVVVHVLYRVRSIGKDRLPEAGPVVLVCNHVSFVDAIVIMGESPRPIRFVMDHRIFKIPILRTFFNQLKAIPIASAKHDPDTLQRAHESIQRALDEGEMVCIFPGGKNHRHRRADSVQAGRAAHCRAQSGSGDSDGAARVVGLFLFALRRRGVLAAARCEAAARFPLQA